MDERIKQTCDAFVDNWEILKKVLKKDNEKVVLAASTIFTAAGVVPVPQQIIACDEYIIDHSAKSEGLRGGSKPLLACKMVLAAENGVAPIDYFNKVRYINGLLKVFKWLGEDFRMYASIIIADCSEGDENNNEDIRFYLNETGEIFERLKEKFGKKLGEKDYVFSAMLAATDYELDPLLGDVFSCYAKSVDTFKDGASCRAMSYILSSGDEDTMVKRRRVINILSALEKEKFKFGAGMELAFIAAMGPFDMDADYLAKAYLETEEYLRMDKHCRGYTMKPPVRNMYTSVMLWLAYKNDFEDSAESKFNDVLSVMIQSEVAIIAANSSSLFNFR